MGIERREGDLPDVKARPWSVICDEPQCVFQISTGSVVEARLRLESHPCPHLGGPTTLGYSVTLSILEKCWIKLDATVTELMEGKYPPLEVDLPDTDFLEHPEKTRLKGVCRGMAEVIAEFMSPHFKTADEVSTEAGKRYKAKKAGEPYETVGLGHLKYKGAHDSTNPGRQPAASQPTPKPSAAQQAADKLGDKEKTAIRHAMASGMFEASDIAKMYGVSAETINLVNA